MSEEKALTKIETTIASLDQARELMETNLGGEEFSAFDLDRIKIPQGGSTTWEIPALGGEESAKEINGIIADIVLSRVYWETSFEESGGGDPPDCYSIDNKVGIGNPGGECKTCPMNQWDSADTGVGKACAEVAHVFLIMPDRLLPAVLSLPPTSLRPLKQYRMRLTSAGLKYYWVMTKVKLEKAKSKSGITYSQSKFLAGDAIPKNKIAELEKYINSFKSNLSRVDLAKETSQEDI